MRRIGLPSPYLQRIEQLLLELDFPLARPARLAECVKRLSTYYIENPQGQTPWNETWARAAYLAYFFPLNYARNKAVADEGLRVGFFSGLDSLIDLGSGPGSTHIALAEALAQAAAPGADVSGGPLRRALCIDRATEALDMHRALLASTPAEQRISVEQAASLSMRQLPPPANRLGVLSYVYTELSEFPRWAEESEALMILEPSTRDDGRRLLELRQRLLEAGFHAWAPCTHQDRCPLLELSQKDWCHDRISWDEPDWWPTLEKHLPMKNRTLTFSYLLMRRTPPSKQENASMSVARMTGDPLVKKGKTRQLICRGPQREFLSWFPGRMKDEPHLDRGQRVQIASPLESRASELRLKHASDIRMLPGYPQD